MIDPTNGLFPSPIIAPRNAPGAAPEPGFLMTDPAKSAERNPFRTAEFLAGLVPPGQSQSPNPFLIAASPVDQTAQSDRPDLLKALEAEGRLASSRTDYDDGSAYYQTYGSSTNIERVGNVFMGTNYGHVTQTVEEYNVLRNLPIHPDISGHLSEYFPDSRADDEERILEWVDSNHPPELVLCVLGKVGVGKLTLAKQLATRLRLRKRLAAEAFLSFALPDWSPESMVRMMAGQLCGTFPVLTRAVCEAIRLDINPSVSLETRLEKLILEPIRSLRLPHPLVILLDALDQWAPHLIFVKALGCFAGEAHLIRFVVLGRPGLEDCFQNVTVRRYDLLDVVESVMGKYFRERFNQVQWEYGRKPSAHTIDQLVNKARGLFIWSSTLCSLLEDELSCPNPHDTLTAILQSQQSIGDNDILAILYHDAINLRFPKPDHKAKLRVLLGALLVLQEPLPVAVFAALVSMAAPTIRKILADVRPLQIGQMKDDQDIVYPAPLRFHLSFLEYLQSTDTPPHLAFPINIFMSHSQLGKYCLDELRRLLSSPHSTFITPLQKYAMRYWPTHTAHGTPPVTPTSDVEWRATPHFAALKELSVPQWQRWATLYLQLLHPGTSFDLSEPAYESSETPTPYTQYLLFRTMATGTTDAIAVAEVTVRLHHQSSHAWLELGKAYKHASQTTTSISPLDSAVRACRFAADIGVDGGHEIPAMLSQCLHSRFIRFGVRKDLEEAVSLRRATLLHTPPGHADRASSLNGLADSLWSHSKVTGAAESLDEAITLLREALLLRPPGHQDRTSSLGILSSSLHYHYRFTGAAESLDESIALNREALLLWPSGHPRRDLSLNSLANTLQSYYTLTGIAESQNEAISLLRELLSLLPSGHPGRTTVLNNLANSLESHFRRTGASESLEEAIMLLREALSLWPSDHPDRAMALNNLAYSLQSHFRLTGNAESLDEAIVLHREALVLWRSGGLLLPNRALSFINLANSLQSHFTLTGATESLDEAIALHREALSLWPDGHPSRAISLNNLADALCSDFELKGAAESLDEAIALYREALSLRPPGDIRRSVSLSNLAKALHASYRLTGDVQTREEAQSLLLPDNEATQ